MTNQSYQLNKSNHLLAHSLHATTFVHDVDDDSELEIDAMVASGDCFVMLATALDQMTGEPFTDDPELIKPQLEKHIHTLLYLQRFYEISRKPPEFRQ